MPPLGPATPGEVAAAHGVLGTASPADLAAAAQNQPSMRSRIWSGIKRGGTAAEGGYEKYVAPALTNTVAQTFQDFDPRTLMHPGKTLMNPPPPLAMALGRNIAPQTIPQLGRDVLTLAAPETKLAKLAQLGGMIGGSALLGDVTGKDPETEALYGTLQSVPFDIAGWGGKKIAGVMRNRGMDKLAQETMEKFGAKLVEKFPFLERFGLKKGSEFITAFQDKQAVQVAKDELAQVQGELGKKTISVPDPANPGKTVEKPIPFNVKVPDPFKRGRTKDVVMSFDEANNLIDELNGQGFSSLHGEPPGGVNKQFARKLADSNKNAMVAKLNRLDAGSGSKLALARKNVGAMHTLGEVFDPDAGIFDPVTGVMRQEPMVNQLTKHSPALQRSMPGANPVEDVQALRNTMRHGEVEPKLDIPGKKGQLHVDPHVGFHGVGARVGVSGGKAARPVGTDLPLSMRWGNAVTPIKQVGQIGVGNYFGNQNTIPGYVPGSSMDSTGAPLNAPTGPGPAAPAGAPAASAAPAGAPPPGPSASAGGFHLPSFEGTAYGAEFPPGMDPSTGKQKTPAMDHIEALQNREVAPTPGGASRAGEIRQSLGPGRKPTDITQDLNRGRLSSDEVKKLLQHSSSKNPGRLVSGIPLTDLMSAAETGTPQEKQMLVPLIQGRLQQELPQLANKTMQANLARRFQLLQRGAAPAFSPAGLPPTQTPPQLSQGM